MGGWTYDREERERENEMYEGVKGLIGKHHEVCEL